MTLPARLDLPAEVVEIATTIDQNGFEVWCVGGAVRDAVLGGTRDDVDLATNATPEQIQSLFRRTVPVGIEFGTVGVLDRRRQLHEVTTFRRDVKTDGRHATVEFGVSLDEDLARRDFTINAMAYHPLRHEWADPFGGQADLAAGVVRAVGDPRARFREDYLRILRAIRFACRLDFVVEPETWAAAIESSTGLPRLSAERVREEWFRGLETARSVARFFAMWRETGAVDRWLPGFPAAYPFASEDPFPRDAVLLTAVACQRSAEALERLKAAGTEISRAGRIDRGPAQPADQTAAAVRRWLSSVEPAADDLLDAYRLRHGAPAPWLEEVVAIRSRGDPVLRNQLAVSGDDLRAAGMAPGPPIGRALADLLEHVLEDPARNDRDSLLARALGRQ